MLLLMSWLGIGRRQAAGWRLRRSMVLYGLTILPTEKEEGRAYSTAHVPSYVPGGTSGPDQGVSVAYITGRYVHVTQYW